MSYYDADFGQSLIDREDYDFETQRQRRLDDQEETITAAEASWDMEQYEALIAEFDKFDFEG